MAEDITERRWAEAEGSRILKRLQLLLDSTGQGIYEVDPEGNCTFINRIACEMTGYRPEELMGRNMHASVHHHRQDGSPYPVEECPVSRAIAEGKGCKTSSEVLWRKDGTPIPVEYSSFPIIEAGKVTGAVVTTSDLTEQKTKDQELQSILDNSPAVVVVKAADGRYLRINRQFEKVFAVDRSNVIGKTDQELFPQEIAERFRANDLEVTRAAGPLQFEETAPHTDGIHHYLSIKFPLRDAGGEIYATAGFFTDITELKRAEEALQQNERLFRSIFENSQIGISFYNIEGRAIFTNRAFQEMLGYDDKELSQLDKWDKIIHPDERVSGAERYAQLVQGKREIDEWEQRFIRRDGRIIVASARFTLIRDANGKPQYVASLTEDITEKRQADERLRASEQLFRSIFEGAQIGIGVYKIDTQEHISNLALHEMLGYTGEELSRLEQWDSIVPKEEREAYAHRYEDVVQGKTEKDEYEQHFIRRDGQKILSKSRFQLLRDSTGKPQSVVALTEDVTERKRAEEERERAMQLFRSVFENAQIGIGIYNIQTGEHTSNRSMHAILGYSQEELSGIGQWDKIIHPDERASGAQRYLDLIQGKRDEDDWEQRFIQRDGQIVIANGRFRLLRDQDGKPQYIFSFNEDITQRKRAEDELRRANFLAETALELAKAGYWHVPLDGSGWYESSPRRVALFGEIPRADYRYQLDEFFTHAEEGDEAAAKGARKAFSDAVEGKADIYDAVFAYKRPVDGRITWGHALGRVVKDGDGKPTDMYGVSQDITEFKRMEAEIVTAKEVAVAATKAKSEFLANMSHEIRTPMNAILGMTHLALKTELTPKQRDYLTKTKSAAQSLLAIINDVLDFSKVEAGKLDLENTDFRLDHILENLSSIVSQKAHDKNLEFLIRAPHDLPQNLVGDPLRLGQILINLVNNAVKFTEQGGVTVAVAVDGRNADRVRLKFSVRDSGIGMTPDQAARLFTAFTQADTSITRKYGGTGLGLSICKRLVELMGGEIWVESDYSKGSTFLFTAWFGVGSGEPDRKRFIPSLAGLRALVVDDNEVACEVLSDALRAYELRVDSVSSGVAALRELAASDASDPYRMVFMDWHMPGMDGLEVSRRVLNGGELKHVPVIVMVTAFGQEEIRAQAEEIGVKGYLLKPVSSSMLYDTLMDVFGVGAKENIRSRSKKEKTPSANASGVRILLVEDNEVNQQVAKELLESVGASVTVASNGVGAVKILTEGAAAQSFDIVLMDLQMPEMDGFTATRVLRADPRFRSLPIIAMTAHALVEERQRCLEAGMNDHVSKPIDPDTLFATLLRWAKPCAGQAFQMATSHVKAVKDSTFPDIEGVDVVGGLNRVAGNKRLYHDLLGQFVSKQKSAGERIAASLESGDRSLAERLAHSLKGAAGNLGVNQIFDSAGKLERAIRESREGLKGMVKKLTFELTRQIETIEDALKATSPPIEEQNSVGLMDPSEVLAAVARLRKLLESSDADAPEAYARLAQVLRNKIDSKQLEALGAAVRAFDFEASLIKLREIADRYKPNEQ